MSKVNLTSEEKAGLIEAINNGVEPKPDLLPKLFSGTAEKFDVQALDRAKIPTLEYAGKRWTEEQIRNLTYVAITRARERLCIPHVFDL